MEKLTKDGIREIYIGVLKRNRKIRIIDGKVVMYCEVGNYYHKWTIKNNELWHAVMVRRVE